MTFGAAVLHLPSPPDLCAQDGDHADVALDPLHTVLLGLLNGGSQYKDCMGSSL